MPPSSYTLRPAALADAALLAELGAAAFYAAFASENDPDQMAAYLAGAFSPEKQAAELCEPGSQFLLAYDGQQIAGYVRLKDGPAPACVQAQRPLEIARFYAHPEYVGRGVGAAMLQACLDEAARLGCDVVWLSTWQRNPRGLAFYQKWGFAIVGETTFRLGDELQQDYILARKGVVQKESF